MFNTHEHPEWAHAHRDEPDRSRRGARRRGGPFGPGSPRGRGRGTEGQAPESGPDEGGFPGPWGPDGPRGRRRPGGRGRGGHGRGRRPRGDVRLAILALLREGPRHGYQIIQEITERSGGSWRPSPGSVYPAVSQLADEDLVDTEKESGRTIVHLTEQGRRYTQEHAAELDVVWSQLEAGTQDGFTDLRTAERGLAGAVAQVTQVGTTEQVTQATGILNDARRRLYLLLAEIHPTADTVGDTDEPSDEVSDDKGSEGPVGESS